MAKYKKKKDLTSHPRIESPVGARSSLKVKSDELVQPSVKGETRRPKRMASGSLTLQFAGDLILVKNSEKSLSGLFKRYSALFETLANMSKEQRGLVYKIITGLMLTSHAKKMLTADERRRLFGLKNDLFVTIANDRQLRRQVEFKYLVSKNFRVSNYCEACTKTNSELGLERHRWKYCKQCQVDHNFYNLLSMEVRFNQGFARIFLSNDQLPRLEHFKLPRRMNIDLLKEEAMIDQFHYNTRNLDAIEIKSVMGLYQKAMELTSPGASPSLVKR